MDKVPWKHISSVIVAIMGLGSVLVLASLGAVHDGETTSAIATVLASTVAIHNSSRKEDNDDGG